MEVIILAVIAVGIGFFVIFLNRRPPSYLPMRGEEHPEPGEEADLLNALTFEQFQDLCIALIRHMELEPEAIEQVETDELEIRARDGKPVVGGMYILIGVHRRDGALVTPPSIANLYSVVRDEHAAGGILVTNGQFAAAAAQMLEAERLQLINGKRLIDMVGIDTVKAAVH